MGRVVRRALVGATLVALLASGAVAADTLRGDSDVLTAGVQSSRDLGNVVAGSVVDVPVSFVLTCANSAHVDVGQSVTISLAGTTSPTLTFRAWVSTEGSVWDGYNLKISTDGTTFTLLTSVT